jgi:mono/diheme cytochrome c family protein
VSPRRPVAGPLAQAAALALLLTGCGSSYLWPASMEQQPAIRPLAEARPAPPGSVPLGGLEVVADREDLPDAAAMALDAAAATRGQALFARLCTSCHGAEAKGDGPVSAKFPQAPNLRHVSICKRTDGFLYGTLTVGGKAMPPMREGTTARDRWDLVAYVRALQREGCTGTLGPQGGVTP